MVNKCQNKDLHPYHNHFIYLLIQNKDSFQSKPRVASEAHNPNLDWPHDQGLYN